MFGHSICPLRLKGSFFVASLSFSIIIVVYSQTNLRTLLVNGILFKYLGECASCFFRYSLAVSEPFLFVGLQIR